MITSLLKKTIKPAIHSLVLLSYLVSFVLPVNVAYAHTEGVSGASIPAPPAPIIKDQQAPQAVPAAPDFGDIAVDKNNPKAPQLDVAPNGVPLVNIRKPDARGLSHNQFEKLNVGTSGIIFNNSTEKNAQSILGGTILGNSALQGQNARIILTEVTGRDTSTIRGYLEVHGKAAELIIVNPNGIDVNGAGFINIPKATLSTGQLQDLSNGKPIQLKVDGGEITIQGKGLDLKGVSQFDIVTRKVNFDGKLYGAEQNTDVSVRAGKQIYDHENRTSHAHDAPSAEAAPVYAIDSSALGGMYAGKIALISTEKGVGVRAPENMASRMSDITILANGDVVLKNAEAQGKLDVKSKSGSVTVEEGKTIQAQRAIDVTATKKVTVSQNAKVQTMGSLQITGGGFENQGVVASSLKTNISAGPTLLNHGEIVSEGSISLSAKKIDNFGKINGENNVKIRAQNGLTNHAGSETLMRSGGHLDINTAHLVNESKIRSDGALRIQGSSKALPIIENHADGIIEGMSTLHIVAQSLLNQGLIFSRGYMDMSLDENMANNGWIYSQNGAHIGLNGDFVNSYRDDHIGGEILVTGPLTIEGKEPGTKARSIVNSSGLIETFGPDGNMLFRGVLVENKMKHFRTDVRTIERTGNDKEGSHTYEDYIIEEDDPAYIYASGNIEIDSSDDQGGLHNDYSFIQAAGDVFVNGQLFQSAKVLNQVKESWKTVKKKIGSVRRKRFWKKKSIYAHVPKSNPDVVVPLDVVEAAITAGRRLLVTTNGQVKTVSDLTANLIGAAHYSEDVPYIPSGYGGGPHVPDSAADYAVSLDHSPLYETHLGAGHAYLFETRKQYADPRYVLGSDYFFTRIGPFAGQPFAAKRMGDAFVETRFLRKQIFENGLADRLSEAHTEAELMRQLYDNAVEEAKDLELYPGIKMTAELISKLKRDIIWMETEIINGEEVLVPRLYVSKLSTKNLPPLRSGIYGEDVILNVANLHNEGVIQAKKALNVKVTGNATQVGGTMDGKQTKVAVDGVLNNQSGTISGDVTDIKAKQILNETLVAKAQHGKSFIESAQARGSFIARDGKLTVEAGEGGIGSRGGHFAGEGGIDFTSAGTDYFGAASISSHTEARGKGFRYREDHTKHQKTTMNSGAGTDITFKTAGDHIHEGVDIKAGRDVLGEIDGTFTSTSVHDTHSKEMHSKTKGSWGRKSKQDSEHHSDRVNRNSYESETGSVSFVSKENATMVAPKVRASEDFELISTEGKTSLKADQSSESHRESSSGSSLVWQTSQDKGSSDTTVEVADVKAESYNLQGALGTEIDLKANGNLEQTLAALSQNPDTAWLAELAKDPDVQVHLLKEYHKHWNHKQSGLTAGGAAIIALAVAIATAGAGSAVSAGVAGAASSAGMSTAMAGLMGAMSKAAFMSLVSSASVSLVNNKGDFGKVFAELASKQQMRSLAVAILTANTAPSGPLDQITVGTVLDKAQGIVVDSAYKAGVQTAIMGGKFGDHFKQTVQTAGVNAIADQVVDAIGQRYHASEEANAIEAAHPNLATENPALAAKLKAVPRMNPFVHFGAHAVTGAGTAALKGEDKKLGALGQVAGELGGMVYKKIASENLAPGEAVNKETGVNVAKFVAGTAAVLVTGGQKDVSIAIDTGGRAAEFNAYSDQKVMEGRDSLKKKIAAELVEKGLISKEDLDANYDHMSLADMADIYTESKKIIKIEGPSDFAQWSTAKQQQFIIALQKMGAVEALKYVSDKSNAVRARNNDVWIDPKSDRGQMDTVRTARQDIFDQINDYGSVLFGNYERPEDHRNLALGSSIAQITKDTVGLGMSLVKWNTQFIGEAIGGANGADIGRAVPDVVIIVTGAVGAAKGAAAGGKVIVNIAKTAGGATKDAAKAAGRATGVLKEAPVVMRASEAIPESVLQAPYDPFRMRADLEAVYGARSVKSTTLAPEGAAGMKFAGQMHAETKVVYDMRGNPMFDTVENGIKYQTMLTLENFYNKNRAFHMRASTRQLRVDIKSGIIPEYVFSETQLKAIMGGKAKIPGYTWHHDQQLGRMQLVVEDLHKTPHIGSVGLLNQIKE